MNVKCSCGCQVRTATIQESRTILSRAAARNLTAGMLIMDENTRLIVNACKKVVQSADDHDNERMTIPLTVVQAIYQLLYVIDKVEKEAREKADRKSQAEENQLQESIMKDL